MLSHPASHLPAAARAPQTPAATPAAWSWEQDAGHRFVRVRSAGAPTDFDLQPMLGRAPWDVPGAVPVHGSWDDHRRELAPQRPFHGFVCMVEGGTHGPRYFSVSGSPLFDAGGGFAGYQGSARDVTPQWLQQRKLNEAEMMLKIAPTLSGFGAWSVDLATSRLSSTNKALSLHQAPVSHQGAMGRHILSLYAPQDRERLLQAYVACVASGTPFDLQVRALNRRRQELWVRVIGAAVRNPAGEVVGVQGAWLDIDASKTTAKAHREHAHRMRTMLDSLTDGFMTLDRQWRLTYVNAAAEQYLDKPAGELVGRELWEVFPEARGTVFEDTYRQAMGQGVTRRFDAPYPPLGMWFRVSAFPSEHGIAVSFTDVTAAHEAHARLLQLNEELERRVRERTEELRRTNDELASFTQAVAHELREPLAGISGFSRAAEDRLPGLQDKKTRHFLSRIRAGVARMEGMVEALLELARVGRAELEPRSVNLTALVECSAELLRAQEPGRDARVEVEPGLVAEGDARLLRTLVDNLVGSVWKAGAGREHTVICVGRGADGAFFVRDNAAVPDLVLPPDLSAPHGLLTVDGESGGDAIALASARRVVARHGGRIWTESGPQGGLVFWFTLPRSA